MRSAPSLPTSVDNKIGYNFSMPRSQFLQPPVSSLQAAAGGAICLVTLGHSRSFSTNSYIYSTHHTPFANLLPPGLYQQQRNSTISIPSSSKVCTSKSTPSAFSSLRQASREAGLHTSESQVMASSDQWPINLVQSVNLETPTTRSSSRDNGKSHHETEYNEEEPEMTWNPPIREAIFSASSPLPIYSPLTVPGIRSTPTPSYARDHVSAYQAYESHLMDQSSGSRYTSGSPYAFVPIQEWDNEFDDVLSYKENASDGSISPTKLSSASKSWEPRGETSRCGIGRTAGNDHQEYSYHHHHIESSKQPFYPSNLKTPTKSSSSFDHYNKEIYGNSNKMAPSPTFTVETADMTLDTPSTTESYSAEFHGIKANGLLLAISGPPIYSSPSKPPSHLSRCNVSNKPDVEGENLRQSSRSVELPSGQHRQYMEHTTIASHLPNQGSIQVYGTSPMQCSEYNFCYPVNDQDHAQFIRSQSAPTLGRPTFVAPTKSDEDAQQRKCRVKTELCMHYENGRPCPFGTNCTYAHGEEELQMTKLIDLHEAGLVDMNTYRTKPCLTWVATGSCPFGKRCTGLHDYRVGSSSAQSWLPHTETQGNTIATDINVDGLHQKRLHTILYDNPFGDHFTLTSNSPSGHNSTTGKGTWDDLKRLVSGGSTGSDGGNASGKNHRDGWIAGSNKRGARQIHPIYKLQIALKMRGTDPDWQYKYRPQHVVHDELCMILQKRAFRVTSNEHGDGSSKNDSNKAPLTASNATAISSVTEIPLSSYNSRSANQILVHEIAFGPDSDPSVRGVALWFNISDSDITECTPQQAKRFRWKKNVPNTTATSSISDNKSGLASAKASLFDSGGIESFVLIRPHDAMAFRLVTDIMKLRLSILKRERMSNLKERFETQQKLKKQEERLKERFNNQRRSWLHWAWPVNCGRDCVDHTTPVPPVEGPYLLKIKDGSDTKSSEPALDVDSMELGKNIHAVWNSFVGIISEENENERSIMLQSNQKSKRLSVFESLGQGIPLCEDRRLPHILKDRTFLSSENNKFSGGASSSYSVQQERCWKSLLLLADSSNEANEWEIVREHFENSRSKKVLSIIQQ